MSVTINIDGVRDAVRKMDEWKGTRRDRLERVVKEATINTERKAKQNADFKMGYQTGRLRSSIRGHSQGLDGKVFTEVHYAPYLEYGTVKMQAQPYMIPAWDSERPFYLARVKRALK